MVLAAAGAASLYFISQSTTIIIANTAYFDPEFKPQTVRGVPLAVVIDVVYLSAVVVAASLHFSAESGEGTRSKRPRVPEEQTAIDNRTSAYRHPRVAKAGIAPESTGLCGQNGVMEEWATTRPQSPHQRSKEAVFRQIHHSRRLRPAGARGQGFEESSEGDGRQELAGAVRCLFNTNRSPRRSRSKPGRRDRADDDRPADGCDQFLRAVLFTGLRQKAGQESCTEGVPRR